MLCKDEHASTHHAKKTCGVRREARGGRLSRRLAPAVTLSAVGQAVHQAPWVARRWAGRIADLEKQLFRSVLQQGGFGTPPGSECVCQEPARAQAVGVGLQN